MIPPLSRKIRLPWFRVHLVVYNDPGRLISVHLVHTGLVAGWSGAMTLYELILWDTSDPIFNPMWRQACYVVPFMTRIGVLSAYEEVSVSHLILSGVLILASFFHWLYDNLDLFLTSGTRKKGLDLPKVFGLHLYISSLLCYRSIAAHHIVAGFLGLGISVWHISTRPGPFIYACIRMKSIESVLASSIIAVSWSGFINSASVWYGSVTAPVDLLGPTRFHWDNGYFNQEIESWVKSVDSAFLPEAYSSVPDKLIVYDYLGSNPAKGGLFRSGAILKGDGIIQNWVGNASFSLGTLLLSVRRAPSFFETFPVLLTDRAGSLRADIAFRRSSSRYSIEQVKLVVYIQGGLLSGSQFSSPVIVKSYARKAQLGSIFGLDKKTPRSDGIFRTSLRGWYSFSHVTLSILFFLGHLWHAARALLFKEFWTGVAFSSAALVEYGFNEKLGDDTTSTSNFL